jgi:hypothetical protein
MRAALGYGFRVTPRASAQHRLHARCGPRRQSVSPGSQFNGLPARLDDTAGRNTHHGKAVMSDRNANTVADQLQ